MTEKIGKLRELDRAKLEPKWLRREIVFEMTLVIYITMVIGEEGQLGGVKVIALRQNAPNWIALNREAVIRSRRASHRGPRRPQSPGGGPGALRYFTSPRGSGGTRLLFQYAAWVRRGRRKITGADTTVIKHPVTPYKMPALSPTREIDVVRSWPSCRS